LILRAIIEYEVNKSYTTKEVLLIKEEIETTIRLLSTVQSVPNLSLSDVLQSHLCHMLSLEDYFGHWIVLKLFSHVTRLKLVWKLDGVPLLAV
jgi:hypothetical protein